MAKCQVPPASGKTSWASSATEIPCCESPFCWGFQFSWGFVCICQLKLNLTWDLYRVMSPHSFRLYLYFVFALVCISYMLVCFLFVFVFVFSVFASACISYIIRLFYQCGGICGSQFQRDTHRTPGISVSATIVLSWSTLQSIVGFCFSRFLGVCRLLNGAYLFIKLLNQEFPSGSYICGERVFLKNEYSIAAVMTAQLFLGWSPKFAKSNRLLVNAIRWRPLHHPFQNIKHCLRNTQWQDRLLRIRMESKSSQMGSGQSGGGRRRKSSRRRNGETGGRSIRRLT